MTCEPYVLPGTGWPDDPATPSTPVAHSPEDVAALAAGAGDLRLLTAEQSVCRACPRLVAWREQVAVDRRAAYADERYWGRPIAGWGDDHPKVLIVGLAPAAHGGNRTGRVFTGDRSGDWLFASLHRVGLAAQATSRHAGDGQQLLGARMVAAVRCAPPANKPTTIERDTCAPWLDREVTLVADGLGVVVALGAYAWDAVLACARRLEHDAVAQPRARFGHGAESELVLAGSHVVLLGSYHPSQQNTFTGRLTEPMLDAVLRRAAVLAGTDSSRN